MLKIPKKFNICGREIKVIINKNLLKKENLLGKCIFDLNEIHIADSLVGDVLIETFYHEYLHWIFYMLDEEELNKNEQLINQMSSVICQYMKTKKY